MTKQERIGKASVELQLKDALQQWEQRVHKQINEYATMKKHDVIGDWTVSQWLRFFEGQRNEICSYLTLLEGNYIILKR